MPGKLEITYSKCNYCDCEFKVQNITQKFCSISCRKKAYYKLNSEKEKARANEYKLKNPLVAKGIKLKRYYNITTDTYYQMLSEQNNVCKICKNVCSTGRELCVDHCHKTGKVRGLLCGKCNTGLGSFKDNKEFLLEAIKYLGDGDVN